MQTILGKHWHHLPAEEITQLLDTRPDKGLDIFTVRRRQERFGPNQLTPAKGKSPLLRFLMQFHNPLIYILLASSLITLVVKQELVDSLVIFGVVLVNAIIGYAQEERAEKAIEALAQAMNTEASVLRSGETQRLPAGELVPGDIILLKAGDKVPADLRLLRTRSLQIAEAALTGESQPVEKDAEPVLSEDTVLAERKNMAYSSTLVTFGQGTGVVIATGDQTEIGRISQLIASAEEMVTPLTRKLAALSKALMWVILALAAITFGVETWRGASLADTFTAAVALAVAAIPEGLPAALTVTLAIGVSRMAKRRAIIRKLPAVEALGSVTVVCSDKTGTLTQNQMTVQEAFLPGDEIFTFTGSGYAPQGQVLQDGTPVQAAALPGLHELLLAGALCNDSVLRQKEGRWEMEGDPTEAALVVAVGKGGLEVTALRGQLARVDEIPFESQYQYMATLHEGSLHDRPHGMRRVYLKGAAEVILAGSDHAQDAGGRAVPVDCESAFRQVELLSARGLRVLGFARLDVPSDTQRITHEMLTHGLIFLGLQAMIDPPRPEAIDAVAACQRAGIRVKMITGDHALTAAAIAQQLGIGSSQEHPASTLPTVLTGKALAEKSDSELIEVAQGVDIFARVSPEQKLRLVEALQARGEIVAMTGDGVNDGPALKQSNVGVAMGITGTDVSKEAADMVLTDDNFATIRAAVEEGRGVFDNLTKIIAWTLPTNIGEGLIIMTAVLASLVVPGVELPILPVQILWINMVSVTLLGLVLALEVKEADIMSRSPRPADAPILNGMLIRRMLLVGLLILAAAFSLFNWEIGQGASVAAARTAAVNVVILISIFYLFNSRSLTRSIFEIGLFSNPWAWAGSTLMILLQLLFTYAPFMNTLFESAPVELEAWGRTLIFGLAAFILVEVEKWFARRATPKP